MWGMAQVCYSLSLSRSTASGWRKQVLYCDYAVAAVAACA